MNGKLFNLASGVNESRFIVQHELCKCKCGLNESVCVIRSQNGIVMNFAVSVTN